MEKINNCSCGSKPIYILFEKTVCIEDKIYAFPYAMIICQICSRKVSKGNASKEEIIKLWNFNYPQQ